MNTIQKARAAFCAAIMLAAGALAPHPAYAAPEPPSTSQYYQPLIAGARWNYACGGGISATRTIMPGFVGSNSGLINMLTLTLPGQPQIQFGSLQVNDAQGTKIGGFAFAPTFPGVPINPPQLEFPLNPVIGQTFSFADGSGGTITVTYQGFSTVSVPAGTYNAGVFRETDSGQSKIPFPRTLYMVKGVGEVQSQLAALPSQGLPAVTCSLVSFALQ